MIYKYTILSLVIILTGQLSLAQQMPIDFSDGTDAFTAFAGSGFSTRSNPDDGSDIVAQFFNDGSDPWQGFLINLSSPIDLSTQQIITLDFYAFDPINHSVMVKLEDGSGPDVQVSINDSGSGWENGIAFNFANAIISSDGNPINATGIYNRLVIFIDGGSTAPGTYLIDDINNGSTSTDPNAIDIEYTNLVWSDEFTSSSKTAVSASNWHHQTDVIIPGVGWANNEEQHYTSRLDNSFVENGFLNIVAKKETYMHQGITMGYTSARLNSKYAFRYGRVDVRAKLPAGDGTWPAIWTLGKNVSEIGAYWQTQGFGTTGWPACGEIDIMEHGLGPTNHTSSALHTPSSSGNTVNVASQVISDVANNFHVYSVNWSPNQITFLVDGVEYYTYNPSIKDASTWPFDLEHYLILNVAMGGISGAIDPAFTQSAMIIDYVRVYQATLSTEAIAKHQFKVFPNPAKSKINIQSEVDVESITIHDVLGKLVLHKSGPIKSIGIDNLTSGMYLLRIYAKGNVTVKKVMVN